MLLESGSNAERAIVRSAQSCVFVPFWQLLLLRKDPASSKAAFPADVVEQCLDFCKSAIECLEAQQSVLCTIELKERWERGARGIQTPHSPVGSCCNVATLI